VTTQSASPNSARTDAGERTLIACPFVYANGRACTGHVVRVEAYKADLTWSADADDTWSFDFRPRSHYHVFCSEKGNHAGFRHQDPNALKFWFDTLPAPIQRILEQTKPT
jgi:hypothetical protein